MFNSLGRTPSPRVTTHPPQHHSHRCPLFQIQRKAPTSPKSPPPPSNSESKSTDFTNPHPRAPLRPSDSQNPTRFVPKLPLKLHTRTTPSKGRTRQNRSPKTLF